MRRLYVIILPLAALLFVSCHKPHLKPPEADSYYAKKKERPSVYRPQESAVSTMPEEPASTPIRVTINGVDYWMWLEPVEEE